VPEIAFRKQLETITEVVQQALKDAGVRLAQVDVIGVTQGPGLMGSLLVGTSFAKALGITTQKPLIGVNHLYGHIYANFLKATQPSFPLVALVVSGGHTSLFYMKNFDTIELIGESVDDACGEAFDKVAKILGLGYPGGPLIERIAQKGSAEKIHFSCSHTKSQFDFSFSGIKTAVLYYLKDKGFAKAKGESKNRLPLALVRDIACSFQDAVISILLKKSLRACRFKRVKTLAVAGGVAANRMLRERFLQGCKTQGIQCYFPSIALCMDNAAMIAGLAYQYHKHKKGGVYAF
jgi:N6-L-threonylcarbamoyladenine synthase